MQGWGSHQIFALGNLAGNDGDETCSSRQTACNLFTKNQVTAMWMKPVVKESQMHRHDAAEWTKSNMEL